ncbi:MAG TPA: coenzyme F420-0:L-glutamate ligase [Terriglobia bacterium]|jgi:coenzyme F420-0:L-glutamate ligase/coenzyme F420-1:gamma-L-glutamate ligase
MTLEFLPIQHVPEIQPETDLARSLADAIRVSGLELLETDILAVTQKIVSKAEGRIVLLESVEPSDESLAIARRMSKDPRLVELIRRESRRIVRMRGEVIICETHHGFICANAGIDQSNVNGTATVTLLPKDPDRSARELARVLGCGIIITDTFGRAWREGLVDVAIGIAGVPPFIDFRGKTDAFGHDLRVTLLAAADALSAGAGLAMGKISRTPAAIIRGFEWEKAESHAGALLRPIEKDLFL